MDNKTFLIACYDGDKDMLSHFEWQSLVEVTEGNPLFFEECWGFVGVRYSLGQQTSQE